VDQVTSTLENVKRTISCLPPHISNLIFISVFHIFQNCRYYSIFLSVVKLLQWAWHNKENGCELYTRSTSRGYKWNMVFVGFKPLCIYPPLPPVHPQTLKCYFVFFSPHFHLYYTLTKQNTFSCTLLLQKQFFKLMFPLRCPSATRTLWFDWTCINTT